MTQPTLDTPSDSSETSSLRDLTTGSAGALLLLILVFVCYAWSANCDYVWNDDANVVNNLTLRSFAGLSRIWTEIGATPQYFPLSYTSFWLEVRAFGFSPTVSHVINAALHAGSVLLLWNILRRLRVAGAWVAAAVFAVHPIQVESVAWISERSNVLSLVLGLAATWTYLRFAKIGQDDADTQPVGEGIHVPMPDNPTRLYRLFLAFFVLAVLAKSTIAVLPLILLVIVWWQRGRDRKGRLAFGGAGAGARGRGRGCDNVYRQSPNYVGAAGAQWHLNIAERLALMGQTTAFYAYKLIWPLPIGFSAETKSAVWPPFGISFNYAKWAINTANVLTWLPLIGLVAVSVLLAVLQRRIGRGPLAGVLVFVFGLLPVSGLVAIYPFRYSWVADHFAYAGSIGLIALVVATLATLLARAEAVAGGVAAVVLIALAGVTLWYSGSFRTPKMLWERTATQNPRSWLASTNYALVLMDRANYLYAKEITNAEEEKAVKEQDESRRAAALWLERPRSSTPTPMRPISPPACWPPSAASSTKPSPLTSRPRQRPNALARSTTSSRRC